MIFPRPFYESNAEELNRRKNDNRLDRATRESEKQDVARISRWLRLAEKMFPLDEEKEKSGGNDEDQGPQGSRSAA